MTVICLRGLSPCHVAEIGGRAHSMIERGLADTWRVASTEDGEQYVSIERLDDDGEEEALFTVGRASDGTFYALNARGRPVATSRNLASVLARLSR